MQSPCPHRPADFSYLTNGTLGFQTLLSWMTLIDNALLALAADLLRRFQTLLSWMTLIDLTLKTEERTMKAMFQTLLSWMTLIDPSGLALGRH